MRTLVALILGLTVTGAATAQRIGGETHAPTTCVDVTIGDSRAYDCVNRLLQSSLPPRTTARDPAEAVTAPANQTGQATVAGTRTLLGDSFGTSVVPQRPPPFAGSSPLFGADPNVAAPSAAFARGADGAAGALAGGAAGGATGAVPPGLARGLAPIGRLDRR